MVDTEAARADYPWSPTALSWCFLEPSLGCRTICHLFRACRHETLRPAPCRTCWDMEKVREFLVPVLTWCGRGGGGGTPTMDLGQQGASRDSHAAP